MRNVMMKKRIYFDKDGDIRFISHLDLLCFLERFFKKVNLPIKYSNGFHPRPEISFGNPISLETEAYGEIMDIELEEKLSNAEVLLCLNSTEILGFKVQRLEELKGKGNIAEEYKCSIEGSGSCIHRFRSFVVSGRNFGDQREKR